MSDGAMTTDEPPVNGLLRVIDRLEQMLEASELVELEVEAGGTTVVLRKPEAIAPLALSPIAVAEVGGAELRGAAVPTATAPAVEADAAAASPYHAVLAPLTGVYYTSPSPGAAPYVRVGSPVTQGQVIGLIEAMKLFNEIPADCTGVIQEVLVENQQPVEYGQVLFRVDPAG